MREDTGNAFTIRRLLLVIVLMLLLSFDPAINTNNLLAERTAVEYVMPGRKFRRRGRKRFREPLRFIPVESLYSLQG
jgi:hypothetical protein